MPKTTIDEERKNLSDQPVNLHNLRQFCRVERMLESRDANSKTNRELAELAKVSPDTFQRIKYLLKHADEETLEKLRVDKTSIHKEYNRLRTETRQPPKKIDKEPLIICLKELLNMRRRMLKAKYDFEKANHFFSILSEFNKLLTEFAKMLEQPPAPVFSFERQHRANSTICSLSPPLKRWQTAIEDFQQKIQESTANEYVPTPNSASNVPPIIPFNKLKVSITDGA